MRIGFALMMAFLLVIGGRLVMVQGLDVGNMAQAAENQRTVVQTLPALRGKIIDSKGKVLAESIIRYNITVSQVNFAEYPEYDHYVVDPETGKAEIDPATGTYKILNYTQDEGLQQLADVLGLKFADVKKAATGDVNIVELQGTTGAAPANDRMSGFADAIKADPKLKVIASQTGDFTRSGGKQVMEAFLKSNPKIDGVYAHNDDMALGAIEAIEAAGKVPGKDITIISVDATKDGMTAAADGKINFIVECNPLLGDQLMDLTKKVLAGETVPERVVTEETTFDSAQAKTALPDRKY